MCCHEEMIETVKDYLKAIENHLAKHWTLENLRSFSPQGGKFPTQRTLQRRSQTGGFEAKRKTGLFFQRCIGIPTTSEQCYWMLVVELH